MTEATKMIDVDAVHALAEEHMAGPNRLRGLPRLRDALVTINAALASKSIANSVYKDARFDISRAFDDTMHGAVRGMTGYERLKQEPRPVADFAYRLSMSIVVVPGALKKAEKLAVAHPGVDFVDRAILVMRAFLPVLDAMNQAKAFVVKRQPAVKQAADDFSVPVPSGSALKLVYEALLSFTQDAFDSLVANAEQQHRRYLDRYMEAQEKRLANDEVVSYDFCHSVFTALSFVNERALRSVSIATRKVGSGYLLERLPDFEARIHDAAVAEARRIQRDFIVKNLAKIGAIVERKGRIAGIDPGAREISLASLVGDMTISFQDGSSFSVRNSIVESHSVYGRRFLRFPLTFHNVHMSDGSFHKAASEREMIEVFAAYS